MRANEGDLQGHACRLEPEPESIEVGKQSVPVASESSNGVNEPEGYQHNIQESLSDCTMSSAPSGADGLLGVGTGISFDGTSSDDMDSPALPEAAKNERLSKQTYMDPDKLELKLCSSDFGGLVLKALGQPREPQHQPHGTSLRSFLGPFKPSGANNSPFTDNDDVPRRRDSPDAVGNGDAPLDAQPEAPDDAPNDAFNEASDNTPRGPDDVSNDDPDDGLDGAPNNPPGGPPNGASNNARASGPKAPQIIPGRTLTMNSARLPPFSFRTLHREIIELFHNTRTERLLSRAPFHWRDECPACRAGIIMLLKKPLNDNWLSGNQPGLWVAKCGGCGFKLQADLIPMQRGRVKVYQPEPQD